MAVFREVSVEWDGEEHTFTPSNRLLRRIEREVPIWPLLAKVQGGELPIGDVSFVVAEVLKEVGVDTDEDVISGEIHSGDPQEMLKYAFAVVSALLPSEVDEKKPAAPAKAKPKAKAKKRG